MGNSGRRDATWREQKEKPWGYERPVTVFRGLHLKELFFKKGKSSSLHFHEQKEELLYVVYGEAQFQLGEDELRLEPGDWVHIQPGQNHRIRPLKDTLILEIGTQMFGDIKRLEDEYNRPKQE